MTTTIAVMTYNQPYLVGQVFRQIGNRLLIIDNGSTEPLLYTTIRVPENRYFAGGWNYAMEYIEADWVAMLNDDITGISVEMIDKLIEEAEKNNYAVISPSFNSPHSQMQPQSRDLHQVNHIDWVAAIIKKEAWNAAKGFNAEAFPGYGSDLDLCYRLKRLGYKFAVDDRYTIHHIGGVAAVSGGTQHIQGNVAAMNESLFKLYGVRDWSIFVQEYLNEIRF